MLPKAHALEQEKSPQWEARAPHLEKAFIAQSNENPAQPIDK